MCNSLIIDPKLLQIIHSNQKYNCEKIYKLLFLANTFII